MLVVGNAETIGTIPFESKRLLGEHSLQVDSVHVGQQEDPSRAGATESCHHRSSDLRRSILHVIDVGRFNQVDVATEHSQTPSDHLGDPRQTVKISTPRLYGDKLAHRVDERSPFPLHLGQSRFVNLGQSRPDEQKDEAQPDRD